jgi:hypothetical protein
MSQQLETGKIYYTQSMGLVMVLSKINKAAYIVAACDFDGTIKGGDNELKNYDFDDFILLSPQTQNLISAHMLLKQEKEKAHLYFCLQENSEKDKIKKRILQIKMKQIANL